ncbi:MAG TPA: hypothetical protein VNI02_21685 [Blastocatellia bacterium]|jgi:hypothetical protein|nr:hypothetical protein [Blastocatellia bacterium]
MADEKKNQPPAGEGKKQSAVKGESRKLDKRSTITQASDSRQNILDDGAEQSSRDNPSQEKNNPSRPRAGR